MCQSNFNQPAHSPVIVHSQIYSRFGGFEARPQPLFTELDYWTGIFHMCINMLLPSALLAKYDIVETV